MGGHCFLDRCNHLRQSDKEEVSPHHGPFQLWGEVLSLFPSSGAGLPFARCTRPKLSSMPLNALKDTETLPRGKVLASGFRVF